MRRRGVHVWTPGSRPRLLAPVLATETVTTPSRVAFVRPTATGSEVRVLRISGRGAPIVLSAAEPAGPLSLVGTRYRFAWLRPAAGGVQVVRTSRLSGAATSVTLQVAGRLLPASALSITTNDSVPDKFLGTDGIVLIAPLLTWGP